MKWCSEFEIASHARNDVQRAGSGDRDVFSRKRGCRRVVQAEREHSPDVGIRYGATLQFLPRIRSSDSSAHKMLLQSNAQSVRRPNAMLVDAAHMVAEREWQGGNQNVAGRVMRTSLTVFMSRNWVKRGSGEMLRSEVSWSH